MQILQYISANKPQVKVILIDTLTAIMTSQFMQTAKDKGFEK
jgi:hypothetical protein